MPEPGRLPLECAQTTKGLARLVAAFVAAMACLTVTPAMAHKLSVLATAQGAVIRGRAYLHGGGTLEGAQVTLFAPDGRQIGQTQTDADGKFQFTAAARHDHRIVVDSGDGHRTETTVPAAVLPATLPGPEERHQGDPSTTGKADPPKPPAEGPGATHPGPDGDGRLSAQIEILGQQVEQLQMQLAEDRQKARLQDILGGVGYIAGLTGLAFYFLGARRKGSP